MMKTKITLKSILLLILLTLMEVQCEKKEDYRDKYVGSFKFTVEITLHHFSDSTTTDSSVIYNGYISFGSASNNIDIHYLPDHWVRAILDQNGSISKETGSGLGWGLGGQYNSINEVTFRVLYPGSMTDTVYNVIGNRI